RRPGGTAGRTRPGPPRDRRLARRDARGGAAALHGAAKSARDGGGAGRGRRYGEEPAARGPGQTAEIPGMTCDDFLPALETGGFFERAAARRHAAHCPACARVFAAWQELQRELASAPPLSDRERALWTSAAQPGRVRPRTNRLRQAATLAVA